MVSNRTLVDDGSGSVTILEAYRALLAADFRPIRTTEFHWYSAEVHSTLEGVKTTLILCLDRKEGFWGRKPLPRNTQLMAPVFLL